MPVRKSTDVDPSGRAVKQTKLSFAGARASTKRELLAPETPNRSSSSSDSKIESLSSLSGPASLSSSSSSTPAQPKKSVAAPTFQKTTLSGTQDTSAQQADTREAEDDDDDDDDNSETNTAAFLKKLLRKPGRDPRVPKKKGAQPKSGIQQVRDKAQVILLKSTMRANPAAELLGLGPCRLVEPLKDRFGNRPAERMSAVFEEGQPRKCTYILSYHICWAAVNGAPPNFKGMEYSHRCHQRTCVEEGHGVWENGAKNKARNVCAGGNSHLIEGEHIVVICPHEPPCLSGTVADT